MSIKRLINDVFERVEFLHENVDNPFLHAEQEKNPFSGFFNKTYVWVEKPAKDEDKTPFTCD